MRYVHSFVQAITGGVKRVFRYFMLAIGEFLDDNGSHLSASMSYYLLFSIIPLLLAFILVVGVLYPDPDIEQTVEKWFSTFLPAEGAGDLVDKVMESVRAEWTTWLVIGTIILLWGGTAIFNVIRKTLNIIWGITIPRPFFRERLMEVIMVAVVGAVMMTSFWLSFGIALVGDLWELNGLAKTMSEGFLGYFLPGLIMFLIFIFLYRFTPYVKLRFKDVWIEALIAAVIFEVFKNLYVWYLQQQQFNPENFLGTTLGAIFATLLWAYVSSIAFLFCAEMASLRYRGVTIWGRGKVETTEGPLPSFLESRIEAPEYKEKDGGDNLS